MGTGINTSTGTGTDTGTPPVSSLFFDECVLRPSACTYSSVGERVPTLTVLHAAFPLTSVAHVLSIAPATPHIATCAVVGVCDHVPLERTPVRKVDLWTVCHKVCHKDIRDEWTCSGTVVVVG